MKRFYLAGQTNFGNRGCEALVRSTIGMLEDRFGKCEFLVPTFNESADARQWPTASDHGVRFIPVPKFPIELKWWARLNRVIPAIQYIWMLKTYKLDVITAGLIDSSDAVIMIGGDVVSLDYGVAPLLWNTGLTEYALQIKKPVILWAASIGPFSKNIAVERYMRDFLSRLDAITVRETFTLAYLKSIGVERNVTLVADPAFLLNKQEITEVTNWPLDSGKGILGFNISPLIQKFRGNEDPSILLNEVAAFLREAVSKHALGVLLIPHVDSLDGDIEGSNQDSYYMGRLMKLLDDLGEKITILPSSLNACELKEVISKCRYFIGGRTHSTIAALSTGVPTLSIAYSVKAKGLNHDIFGNTRYVLETPAIGRESLTDGLKLLMNDESLIRERLAQTIPILREKAIVSGLKLSGLI